MLGRTLFPISPWGSTGTGRTPSPLPPQNVRFCSCIWPACWASYACAGVQVSDKAISNPMVELKRLRSSGCGHYSGYYGFREARNWSGDDGGQGADIPTDFFERIRSGKRLLLELVPGISQLGNATFLLVRLDRPAGTLPVTERLRTCVSDVERYSCVCLGYCRVAA